MRNVVQVLLIHRKSCRYFINHLKKMSRITQWQIHLGFSLCTSRPSCGMMFFLTVLASERSLQLLHVYHMECCCMGIFEIHALFY